MRPLLLLALTGCFTIETTTHVENINENESSASNEVDITNGCCEDPCDEPCDDPCDDPCGDPCDPDDTGMDTGMDTGLDGPCDSFGPPSPGDPSVLADCAVTEPIDWDPVEQWAWPADHYDPADEPEFSQVMVTPMAADIDNDGQVEVVFTAYDTINAYGNDGALVVLDGSNGADELRITHSQLGGANRTRMPGAGGVALGNLDADPELEICVPGSRSSGRTLVCMNHDGSEIFAAGTELANRAYPVIADFIPGGFPEIAVGSRVYDASGTLVFNGGGSVGSFNGVLTAAIPVAADMDGDGIVELVTGNQIFNVDTGTSVQMVLDSGLDPADGFPAVADVDLDGSPDVVVSNESGLFVFDASGAQMNEISLGTVGAGPPTIAQFDAASPEPEIGIATGAEYMVFDWHAAAPTTVGGQSTTVYTHPNVDSSSRRTGSSVFDFDADGIAEVLYADEQRLHVFSYDGAAVTDRMDGTAIGLNHSSHTLFEYPSLADTNGDGSTDILVASNDLYRGPGDTTGQQHGVRSIGSASQNFANSRPIWNQHAYSISNVDDNGAIPSTPVENWTVWNNFRANDTPEQPASALADLIPLDVSFCADCDADAITLYVPIANQGLADAFDVDITLLDDGSPVYTDTVPVVASGTSVVLGPIVLTPSDWQGTLSVSLDNPGTIDECDDGNNDLVVGPSPCP